MRHSLRAVKCQRPNLARPKFGRIGAIESVVFALLYLNKDQKGYNYAKFWAAQFMTDLTLKKFRSDYLHPNEADDWQKLNFDRFENVLQCEYRFKKFPLSFVLAFLAFKIKCWSELRQNEATFDELNQSLKVAKPESARFQIRQSRVLVDCLQLFLMGSKGRHESKKISLETQISWFLEHIDKRNKTLLPALLDPNPLLTCEEADLKSQNVGAGSVTEAKAIVKHVWPLFAQVPFGKVMIEKFLYPNHQSGRAYPKYPLEHESI